MLVEQLVCRVCLLVIPQGIPLDEGRRKRMLAIVRGLPECKRAKNNNEHLPSWICSKCDLRLPSAASFVALCRRSERRLLRAHRLHIPYDSLHRLYQKDKPPNTLQLIKKESPVSSPASIFDANYSDCDDSEMICKEIPLPVDINIKSEDEIDPPKLIKKKRGRPVKTQEYKNECKDEDLSEHSSIQQETGRLVNTRECKRVKPMKSLIKVEYKDHDLSIESETGRRIRLRECKSVRMDTPKSTKRKRSRPFKSQHKEDSEDEDYTPTSNKKIKTSKYAGSNNDSSKKLVGRLIKTYECEVCLKNICGSSQFIVHRRTHFLERAFKCSHCGVDFLKKGRLLAHIERVHLNPPKKKPDELRICHVCGRKVMSKSYTQHVKMHFATPGEAKVPCLVCKRLFLSSAKLKQHMIIHSDERPFGCNKCDKRFYTKPLRNRHMSVHFEECTFKCETCGKMLRSKITLAQHQFNVHKWKLPSICDICGASLVTKDNLKQHFKALHSNEPGKCKICNEQVSNLREHKKLHAKEMMFRCDLCPKRYGLKRSLVSHIKKHDISESKKFRCKVKNCNEAFGLQRLLEFHDNKVHK